MNELYRLLIAALKTVSEIKWTDLDYGQLDNANMGVKYPCALIFLTAGNKDFDESGSQEKAWTIRLRLAWDGMGNRTSGDAPETILARSLAWTDTAQKVYDLFQGNGLGDYDAFECTSEGMEERSDGIVVYRYIFNTSKMNFK